MKIGIYDLTNISLVEAGLIKIWSAGQEGNYTLQH